MGVFQSKDQHPAQSYDDPKNDDDAGSFPHQKASFLLSVPKQKLHNIIDKSLLFLLQRNLNFDVILFDPEANQCDRLLANARGAVAKGAKGNMSNPASRNTTEYTGMKS